MMRVEIKDGWTPFVARLHKHLNSELLMGMRLASDAAQGAIVEEIYGQPWKDSRGGLALSFKPVLNISKTGDKMMGGAFSNSVYARIQDQGGKIVPRTVKNLAIPVNASRNRQYIWPRNFPGKLSLVKTGRANLVLVESGPWQKTKSGRKRWYKHIRFVLKKSVKIQGKHYLDAATKKAEPQIKEILGNKIQVAIGSSEK